MKKKLPIWVTFAVGVLTAIITFQITYVAIDSSYDRREKDVSDIVLKLEEIMDIYHTSYIGELDESNAVENVVNGYVVSVDKYGRYMTEEEYADMMTDYAAQLVGIGIHIIYDADDAVIEVVNVMPGSPSEKAGLAFGDRIVAVDGESVSALGYQPAVDRVKGAVGTTVTLTIERGGETFDVGVMRDTFTEQTVIHRVTVTSPEIGYVRILSFDSGTPAQFKSAVEELQTQGCTSLVLDVRGNPGGLLDSVVEILDYVLPEGPIVRLIDANDKVETIESDADALDMKLVVICDANTASAGELFTSAIKDYHYATVIGTVTYGKGTVQSIRRLPDGDALSYSYKMYDPPYSDNYEGIGVVPDIIVEQDGEAKNVNIFKLTEETDTQLHAAIAELLK